MEEVGSVLHFLQDKTILLIGATGFIAKSIYSLSLSIKISLFKDMLLLWYVGHVFASLVVYFSVFLEKVLRVQPNVKKVYLLLRASDEKSAIRRLDNEVNAQNILEFRLQLTLQY